MNLREHLDYVQAYGTSEGVKKAWDVRGRGREDRKRRNALLAGYLAVSNSGVQVHGPGRDKEAAGYPQEFIKRAQRQEEIRQQHLATSGFTHLSHMADRSAGEHAVQMASHLIESDEMENAFRQEGKAWGTTLNKMKDDEIKKNWPDAWEAVTGEKVEKK